MLQAVNHAVGPPVGRLVRLLSLMWLAGVAMRMTLLVVPPVIPLVHEQLHMSETQIGLLIGLPLAMFAIAAVPGSLLIARIGAKPALILGMFIAAVAGGARGAAIDVWTLYAASIVTGFGIAIMQPGMPTLVRNWLPGRVGLGTVAYSNGMVVGATLPPIPGATVTPGQLTITTTRATYGPCDAIQAIIANGLAQTIYAPDHQSACTVVTLQAQVTAGWQDVGECMLETPTRLYAIAPGTAVVQTLAPSFGRVASSAQGWPAGTYRLAFTYSTALESPYQPRAPIYSPAFTVD